MDQRLDLITLGVADLARSRAFYVDGLGWEPSLDLPEIVFLQVNAGLLLGLWPRDELAADQGEPAARDDQETAGHDQPAATRGDASGEQLSRVGEAPAAPPFTLAHNVGSEAAVDAAVERVVRAGGRVVKAAQRAAFGGYHAYVADPDGIRWEIAHNPGWRVEPDGRVVLEAVEQ